jgi:hypothetical protein
MLYIVCMHTLLYVYIKNNVTVSRKAGNLQFRVPIANNFRALISCKDRGYLERDEEARSLFVSE